MATHTTIAPGTRSEARAQTRRDIFTAAGATGMAGIAAAAFVRSETLAGSDTRTPAINPDAALLTACAAFRVAHQEQEDDNAKPGWDDAEINRISDNWYATLSAVTAAPRPRTEAGRIAMARAAHAALLDQITGNGTVGISEWASREEILALAALDAMGRVGA